MRRSLVGGLLIAATGALGGCYTGAAQDLGSGDFGGGDAATSGGSGTSAGSGAAAAGAGSGSAASGGTSGSTPGTTGAAGGSAAGGRDAGTASCGLPANIQSILAPNCTSCHSAPPIAGAPMPLETYADLMAPAKSDSTKEVGQVCVTRMSSTTSPMPPAGIQPPTAANIATFQSWVNAGMPQAICAGTSGATGAGGNSSNEGGAASGGSDASTSSGFNTPAQCSSGKTSTASEGATMRPGDACTSCHSNFLGGTVYPTAHEPTLCDGANATGATVLITDAKGLVTTLSVNGVGNFYTSAAIAKPFTAKVLNNGNVRAMAAAQMSGDCNSCHTEQGTNGAPGRIVLP